LAVVPLPEDLPPELLVDETAPGDLPPPHACALPQGAPLAELPAEAEMGVFLEPPRNAESVKAALEWAEEHGLAIMPRVACSEEMLAAGRGSDLALWRIRSPKEGDTVTGIIPVLGTADFDPAQVQFYKVEIATPENPEQWITLGETHNTPVVNGQLETLHAGAFPPGTYSLRLVVVLWDGNYVGEPDVVTFNIE
jgi:hypothetical protein